MKKTFFTIAIILVTNISKAQNWDIDSDGNYDFQMYFYKTTPNPSLRIQRFNYSGIDLVASGNIFGAGLSLVSGDKMFFTTNGDISTPEMTLSKFMDTPNPSLRIQRPNYSGIDLVASGNIFGAGLSLASGDKMFFTTNGDISTPEMTLSKFMDTPNPSLRIQRPNYSGIDLVASGNTFGAGLSLASGDKMFFTTNGDISKPEMILSDGTLTLAGRIHSREVKVTVNAGADFVFDESYKLRTLEETEEFISQNKHLPEIASETEMVTNGLQIGEMNIKLLQKIEELTLYLIEQNKRMDRLETKNAKLEKEISALKVE